VGDKNMMLRTIIDNHINHEDIFSGIATKAKARSLNQSNEDDGKITLFVPMDEVLFYSYIPDENMGMFDMPVFKEYDLRIELREYKTFAFIYFRENLEEFLNFIDNKFEPILYTTGEKNYVDQIMNLIDPNNVFRYRLYQDDCHLFRDNKQDICEYLKDINLIVNRSLRKKVLIEYSPLTYTMSPDNSKFNFFI
jgi:RNA polymerase II subunit A small phosphatase-like protein